MNPGLIRLLSSPGFAMHEDALRALAHQVSAPGAGSTASMQAAAPGQPASSGGVAIIRVRGVIDQHESMWLDWYGGTSTEGIARRLRAALAMPEISAIVFDIDSPGGSVFGTPELAAEILASRGQKRIVAVANSFAASAAYWIGSAAEEFYVTPSGEVGSIGCWMAHADWSKAFEQAGITITVIRAGKYKAEGNPYEPLSDEAKDHRQAGVDRYHTMFLQAVAKQRGVTVAKVRTEYGEGRMLGAKDALAAGMVDGIATLDEVIAKTLRTAKRGARAEDDDADPEQEPGSPDDDEEAQQARRAAVAADIDLRRRHVSVEALR